MHTPKVLLLSAALLLLACRFAYGGDGDINGQLDGSPLFGMDNTADGNIKVNGQVQPPDDGNEPPPPPQAQLTDEEQPPTTPPPPQSQPLSAIQSFYQQFNSLIISPVTGQWVMIHPEQVGQNNAVLVGVSSVQPATPPQANTEGGGNAAEDTAEQPLNPVATNFAQTFTHLQSGGGNLEEVSILPILMANPAFTNALQQMLVQSIITNFSLRAYSCGSKVHDALGSIFSGYSAPAAVTLQVPLSVPNQVTQVGDQMAQTVTQDSEAITVNTQTNPQDPQTSTQTLEVTMVIINSYRASTHDLPYYCRDAAKNEWTRRYDDDEDKRDPKVHKGRYFSNWPIFGYFMGGGKAKSDSKQETPAGKGDGKTDQLEALAVFHEKITGSPITVGNMSTPETLGGLKIILDFDDKVNKALDGQISDEALRQSMPSLHGASQSPTSQPVMAY